MANLHWHDVMEDGKRMGDVGSPPPARLWKQGLQATLDRLPGTTGVVVLEDTPNPHFDVTGCLIDQMPHTERCKFPRNTAIAVPLVYVEREIAKAHPRVSLGDPTGLMCDEAVCSTYRNGEAMYSDASHLSVRFSASLSQWPAPILDRSLASMVPAAPRRAP
jgi:hypothetical protein